MNNIGENTETKRILSFEDVKNSEIDIFGNKFEMNFSEEYISRLKEIDIDKATDEEQFNKLREMLGLILDNKEAYQIIEKSYKEHENKEFGIQVFIKVMTFIFNEYSKELSSIKGIDFGSKNLQANREQRRSDNYRGYNNRGYRNNRRY